MRYRGTVYGSSIARVGAVLNFRIPVSCYLGTKTTLKNIINFIVYLLSLLCCTDVERKHYTRGHLSDERDRVRYNVLKRDSVQQRLLLIPEQKGPTVPDFFFIWFSF